MKICEACSKGFSPRGRQRFCSYKCKKRAEYLRRPRVPKILDRESREQAEYNERYGRGWVRLNPPNAKVLLSTAETMNDLIFDGNLPECDVGYLAVQMAVYGREETARMYLREFGEGVV